MTSVHYRNRDPRTAFEAALMVCADFAQECRRQGDTPNSARWRNVIHEARLAAGLVGAKPLPVALKQHQHSLPLM